MEDEQLVKNYLQGDEKALEILILKYLNLIYSFIFRSVGNREDAEDLTQEIFLKVWKNLKKFDQEKKLKTWIFAIARNSIIDYARKKKIITVAVETGKDGELVEILDIIKDPSPSPLDIIKQKEIESELTKALSRIPVDDRLLLLLYNNQKITFQEIADMQGDPINSIKSKYRRALTKLKKELILKTHQK